MQAYGFDVADAARRSLSSGSPPEVSGGSRDGRAGDFDRKIVYLERMLAQNASDAECSSADGPPSSAPSRLVLLCALTLPGFQNRGLAVRCTEWSGRGARLLAVGYGRSPARRDHADTPNAVALWSAKNPYTPERYFTHAGTTVEGGFEGGGRARRRLRSGLNPVYGVGLSRHSAGFDRTLRYYAAFIVVLPNGIVFFFQSRLPGVVLRETD